MAAVAFVLVASPGRALCAQPPDSLSLEAAWRLAQQVSPALRAAEALARLAAVVAAVEAEIGALEAP